MGQIIQGRRRLKRQQFLESGTFTVPAGVTSIQYLLASGGGNYNADVGQYTQGILAVTPGQILSVVIPAASGWAYLADVFMPSSSFCKPPIGRKINGYHCTFGVNNVPGYCEIFWEE